MHKIMIEYCTSNTHHDTDLILKKFESDDAYDVIEYGCLGNCGECYLRPFVMVDGEIVATDAVDELSEAIASFIKQQQADREALDKLLDNL